MKNPPAAFHVGGAWEKQTRSAREILNLLIQTHDRSHDDSMILFVLSHSLQEQQKWNRARRNF